MIETNKNKNGHLLLFRGNEWYKELSLEEVQKVMNQNKVWFERLAEQGKVKGGQALLREGAVVTAGTGRLVSDGPFIESKEAIGGYLLLDVETLDEAITIARTNPNLAHGTSIEIRPVTDQCPVDAWAHQLARSETANA